MIQLNSEIPENIRKWYKRASETEIESGKNWYTVANYEARQLAERTDTSLAVASGIISKLSPGVKWNFNVRIAKHFLETGSCGMAYNNSIANARNLLYRVGRHGTFEEVLDTFNTNARKTKNFFANIYNPSSLDYVTVDRWILRAALNDPSNTANYVSPKNYEAITESIKFFALQDQLIPNQVQAIIWETIRRTNRGNSNLFV